MFGRPRPVAPGPITAWQMQVRNIGNVDGGLDLRGYEVSGTDDVLLMLDAMRDGLERAGFTVTLELTRSTTEVR